jgi:hypothetical protein
MCNWSKKLTIKTLSLSLFKAGWRKKKKREKNQENWRKFIGKKPWKIKDVSGDWGKLLHTTS